MPKHPLAEVFGFTTRDFSPDFEIASNLQGDFIMTYDDTDEVRKLARKHNFDVENIPMKNTHHTKMNELCIGRNLEWLRAAL